MVTFMSAMSLRPTFPVSRAPPRIGTLPPLSERPIRRLKKRSTIRLKGVAEPMLNWPAFSRKKSRFSGKKSGNRVRFTCSSSTSACAKSVLTVTSRFSPAVMPYLRSRPTSRSKSSDSTPASSTRLAPPVTNGVMRRSSPRLSDCIPFRLPAMLTRVSVYACGIGAQNACSFLRPMFRMRFMPQLWDVASGKRSVTMGIAISAIQPSSVRRAETCQTPSQSRFTFDDTPKLPKPSPPSPSFETCWSSCAPSGFVTNMYAERESLNVSRMIWKLSSSRMRSESRRISVAVMASGSESKARTPR